MEVEDRDGGLDLGADDYLVQPFDCWELEARARVLMRRTAGEATNLLTCSDAIIARAARQVLLGTREIPLKRLEMTLLELFAARPGLCLQARTSCSTSCSY